MWGDRVAWLGRPWFFVAVVVLAVNDHVLKGAWPGWLTGKLSDVAGVVVVATLLAVLVGATGGTVVAGLAFILLKTVPDVAEAAAPLLGGVTLRDPSDLVALVVLPPLWLGLSRPRPDQARRTRRGWALVGLLAGTLSVTATSAPMEVPLVSLGSADGAIYAEVDPGEGFDDVLLATTDGGRSWAPLSKAAVSASVEWEPLGSHAPRYAQACADDGVCYRTLDSGERGPCSSNVVSSGRPGSSTGCSRPKIPGAPTSRWTLRTPSTWWHSVPSGPCSSDTRPATGWRRT